jgi:hypothetical protein
MKSQCSSMAEDKQDLGLGKVFSPYRPEPQYEVGQKVRVRALDLDSIATIRYIRYDGSQWDYFISWWDGGKRATEWVSVDELAKF